MTEPDKSLDKSLDEKLDEAIGNLESLQNDIPTVEYYKEKEKNLEMIPNIEEFGKGISTASIFVFLVRSSLMCIILGFGYYFKLLSDGPWGNQLSDSNIKNKEDLDIHAAKRGTLTSALSVIVVNSMGMILNSNPNFDKSYYNINLGFIFSNVLGYFLDQWIGVAEGHKIYADEKYRDKLLEIDDEKGNDNLKKDLDKQKLNYITGRFARKPFFRFMVTVLLDMFISEPIQDALKYTLQISGAKKILEIIAKSQKKRGKIDSEDLTKDERIKKIDDLATEINEDLNFFKDDKENIIKQYSNVLGIIPSATIWTLFQPNKARLDKYISKKINGEDTDTDPGLLGKINYAGKQSEAWTWMMYSFTLPFTPLAYAWDIFDLGLMDSSMGSDRLTRANILGFGDKILGDNFDSLLQSIVAIITFFAYTNQTRFYWAYPGPETERIPDIVIQLALVLSIALYFSFGINTPSLTSTNRDNPFILRSGSNKLQRLLFTVVGIALCSAIGFGLINPPKKITYNDDEGVSLLDTYKRIKNDPARKLNARKTEVILNFYENKIFSIQSPDNTDVTLETTFTQIDSDTVAIIHDKKLSLERKIMYAEVWDENLGDRDLPFIAAILKLGASISGETSSNYTPGILTLEVNGEFQDETYKKLFESIPYLKMKENNVVKLSDGKKFSDALSIKSLKNFSNQGIEEADTLIEKVLGNKNIYLDYYSLTAEGSTNEVKKAFIRKIKTDVKQLLELESLKIEQENEEMLFAGKNKTYGIIFIIMTAILIIYSLSFQYMGYSKFVNLAPPIVHFFLVGVFISAIYFPMTSTKTPEEKIQKDLTLEHTIAWIIWIFVIIYCIFIPFGNYFEISSTKAANPNRAPKQATDPSESKPANSSGARILDLAWRGTKKVANSGQSMRSKDSIANTPLDDRPMEGVLPEGAKRKMDFDKINTSVIKLKSQLTGDGNLTQDVKEKFTKNLDYFAEVIKNFNDGTENTTKVTETTKKLETELNAISAMLPPAAEPIKTETTALSELVKGALETLAQPAVSPAKTGAFGKKKKSKKSK